MLFAHFISWTDPASWPWDTLIWIVAPVAATILRPLLHWLRDRRAEGWPSTIGRIESVDVGAVRGWATHAQGVRSPVAEIGYSYSAEGKRYGGRYRRSFRKTGEAREFVRDLKGMTVTVQYNPSNPASSTLLASSVDSLLLGRPPLAARQIYSGPTKDAVPIGPKWILLILACVLMLGLFLR
jgi:Protein of unknown function (DUF3592)